MPFCVLAPRFLQRKGVLFCSRASTSLTEAIGDSSQQAPACLLQRGGDGKGLFQDFGTTRDGDFLCFPWWKEAQKKGTHLGVPLATGRAGEQPLESSTTLVELVSSHRLSSSWARMYQAQRTRHIMGCELRRKHSVVKDTGFRERHTKSLPGAPAH